MFHVKSDMRPLVIELFAGSFGWGAGFVAEGWRSIGFDILHEPYHGPVPEHCQLVLEDVLGIHGSRFKDADAIVASPPCQKYSYMAMPWKRAQALAAWYRGEVTTRVIERDGKIVDEMVPVEEPADIQQFAEERQAQLDCEVLISVLEFSDEADSSNFRIKVRKIGDCERGRTGSRKPSAL